MRYMLDAEAVAIIRARCEGTAVVEAMDKQDVIDHPADRATLLETARDEYCVGSSDNIEIDDDAQLSPNDENGGCWVQAWVWVSEEDR